MTFRKKLEEMLACDEALKWVDNKTIQECWETCENAEWMMWGLDEMKDVPGWPNEHKLMLVACWCARRALKLWSNDTILKAIEAKEAYAKSQTPKNKSGMKTICIRIWNILDSIKKHHKREIMIAAASQSPYSTIIHTIEAFDPEEQPKEQKIMADYIRKTIKIGDL